METTEWENYGTESGNPQVRQLHGAQRLRGVGRERHLRLAARLLATAKATFSSHYKDDEARRC